MVYAGRDFSPAEQAESQIYGLDFVNDLQEGESLTEAVWELIVREGEDPDPAFASGRRPYAGDPGGDHGADRHHATDRGVAAGCDVHGAGGGDDQLRTTRSPFGRHIQGEPVE